MTKIKYPFILALLLTLSGGVLIYHFVTQPRLGGGVLSKTVYYCPMHPTYTSDKPGNCPICNMKLVKRGKPESHPHEEAAKTVEPKVVTLAELKKMKPGEICLLHKCKMGNCMMAITDEMARLGKCPHCGEDLNVVIKDLMPAGYSHVKLTPEKQQMIGIKTAPAQKIKMTKTIRTVGRIAYDPPLYQAEEEFIQAAQSQKKAETGDIPEIKEQAAKLTDSARLKLKLMGLGDDLIAETEKAGKPDRSLLYSEAGGTVWLYVPVYEYEIPLVKMGQTVEVEVPAITGKKFGGRVRSMDSVLDPVTRTIRIRAVLDNPEGILKPEMYGNATLQVDLGEVLSVPEEAIFATGEKNILFVAKADGFFEPREVVAGISSGGRREIKSGLAEGDSVVVSGNFLIDSESRLKGALEGVSGMEGMDMSGGHKHGG